MQQDSPFGLEMGASIISDLEPIAWCSAGANSWKCGRFKALVSCNRRESNLESKGCIKEREIHIRQKDPQ